MHVLGEALLRAREEGEHPTRAGNVFSRGLGVALWARRLATWSSRISAAPNQPGAFLLTPGNSTVPWKHL